MKKGIIISFLFASALLGSCNDFFDPYPTALRDEEYLWTNQLTVQGLIGACYDKMSTNYNNNEGAYLDCATDNAVRTSRTDVMTKFATGTLSPTEDPFATYWSRDYQGIYNVNMFLKDDRGYNTRFLVDARQNDLLRARLKGEAFALRAWFQWDLLQKFGGRATDGRLLGFPILLEPVDMSSLDQDKISSELNFSRNTYDECVAQIIADCDSAYKYLPEAYRDFLVEDVNDRMILGGQNWGRMDGITTRAIKALVYLTWASPRFNPDQKVERWDSAAKYAKQVIDFKLTKDNVSNGFDKTNAVNWFDPNNPSIVFASRYNASSEAMEKMFWPGGFQGEGQMGPTQELVDAFAMADGYPVGESPNYPYDPQHPYENRENRFYSNIFYNGLTVEVGNSNPKGTYTFETYEGGKDAPEINSKNTRTGYYTKKFVYMGLNWADRSPSRLPHSKFFIRWAHMVLAFAEAANHVVGPTGTLYGLSPKEAIGWLRSRDTYDGEEGLKEDPYLDEIALAGEVAFDRFLRNERRIETCFEGTWFFDLRRWTTSLGELNQAVHGAKIMLSGTSFDYQTSKVEERQFVSAYLPIPYKEVLCMTNLLQNEGWDNWR